MTDAIRIEGLREFNKAVRAVDADLPKATRVALNVSADLVVGRARPKVARRTGRAAGTLRAASTRTSSRVRAGGGRARYYPWLDFGGAGPRNRPPRRPFRRRGRYLYAAYFRLRDSGEFADAMQDALLDVARQAGLDVTSS